MPGNHDASALLEAALNGTLDLDTGAERPAGDDQGADNADLDTTNHQASSTEGADADQGEGNQATEQPAPIASKSGTYTIPYEKLTEARDQVALLKQRNAELEQINQQLSTQQQSNLQQAQQQAQDRADAGQQQTQADANLAVAQAAVAKGVDPALFGDFSEEGIAAGLDKMVDERVAAMVNEKLAPFMAHQAKTAEEKAVQAHLGAIYDAHADAAEIMESSQWSQWLQGLPSYMRAATEQTMEKGSTQQVIEVFNTFKQQSGLGAGSASVRQQIAKAHSAPPNTLTDVPGGLAAQSGNEQLAGARDSASLMSLMEGKSPEEIERLMNLAV